jgi:GDP-4-dehydro-6-deoxy-D-mannose reductase
MALALVNSNLTGACQNIPAFWRPLMQEKSELIMENEQKRIFVTGAAGFVGTYLISYFRSLGCSVVGYDLQAPSEENGKTFYKGDISSQKGQACLAQVLEDFRPDVIFHLAGVLKTSKIDEYYNVHVMGTIGLLESVAGLGLKPRVVVASSSAVYGARNDTKHITEFFQPHPVTHYATSKLTQEVVALRYSTAFDLPVMCVRTFNLLGPGLSSDMAPSAFAKQIAQAEKVGKPAKIFTGAITARRDYVDVRDAIRAYALIAELGKAGQVYNVCSGKAVSIQKCLQILLDQARIPIEVSLDPARMQKLDIPIQIGSPKKIQQLTGWKPGINVKESLMDLLNDWREKINDAEKINYGLE